MRVCADTLLSATLLLFSFSPHSRLRPSLAQLMLSIWSLSVCWMEIILRTSSPLTSPSSPRRSTLKFTIFFLSALSLFVSCLAGAAVRRRVDLLNFTAAYATACVVVNFFFLVFLPSAGARGKEKVINSTSLFFSFVSTYAWGRWGVEGTPRSRALFLLSSSGCCSACCMTCAEPRTIQLTEKKTELKTRRVIPPLAHNAYHWRHGRRTRTLAKKKEKNKEELLARWKPKDAHEQRHKNYISRKAQVEEEMHRKRSRIKKIYDMRGTTTRR